MKLLKNISLIIFLFVGNNLFAQHLIDSTKQWSLLYIDSDGDDWRRTYSYRFDEVSTINDTIYGKLIYSTGEELQHWNLYSYWKETPDNKIFQNNQGPSNWYLTYDFNLQEKDTFIVDEYIYLIVDSVRIKEWGGKERKHLYFHSPGYEKWWWGYTTWIEGIGQLFDFTHSTEIGLTGSFTKLLCFREEYQQVYQNPDFEGCFINVGVKDVQMPESLITIQSLGSGYVRVCFKADESSGRVDFYNLSGQKILSAEAGRMVGSIKEIFLPGTGIYLYSFVSSKGKIKKGKIKIN